MAKKATKNAGPALDATALAHIVAAGEAGTYAPASVYQPLADAGMVEVNTAAVDGNGNHLVRATANGAAAINGNEPAGSPEKPAKPTKPVIMSGFAAPERKRGRSVGDRKYNFDALNVGDFFFVEATAERPEPHKSLASSVTSATARYRVPTGNQTTKSVIVKNSEGQPVIGADGNPLRENVSVPEMTETRKFKITRVEGGVTYGAFTAPANGAVIYREA